jgi:hypothetical protein
VHEPIYSFLIIEIPAREVDVISCEELAKLKASRILSTADDRRDGRGRLDDDFLNTPNTPRHRLQYLTIQRSAMHDEIVKVCSIELHNAGRLERPDACHRGRSEEQRHFPEVVALRIEQERALLSAD